MLAACAGEEEPREDDATSEDEIVSLGRALSANQLASYGAVSWEYASDPNYDHLTAQLGSLVGHGVGLTVNVPTTQIAVEAGPGSPWGALGKALQLGIPLTLFITLPEFPTPMNQYTKALDPTGAKYRADPAFKTTGYFANASNAAEYCAQSTALKNAFEAHFPGRSATILVDMELRKELMPLYKATDAPANQVDFFRRYGSLGRAAEYDGSVNTYRAFVANLRRSGWRVEISTFVQMLDDFADGDASLRRAYGVVLDDPRVAGATEWNRAFFQAFTTLYGRSIPITNYFVYDYARLARSIFGAKAAVDVGLTHGGIDPTAPVYRFALQLAADSSAALAAGIPRESIEVYSYLGMFGSPASASNIEGWLVPLQPINLPPLVDLGTPLFHITNAAADAYFPVQ